MKIAVPTTHNRVEDHFGKCQHYTIFSIGKDRQIINTETINSTGGCGCQSDIAYVLSQHGVEVMLAGNMGQGALRILHDNGIEVLRGCSGDVYQLAKSYLEGKLEDSGDDCQHYRQHHHEHQHEHHHGKHGCHH